MAQRGQSGAAGKQVPPSRLPETNPPVYPGADHSFTLQAVFEIQKTVGQLTTAVETLTEQQKGFATKLDRISHQVYAAIVIILLIGAVLGFFGKSINDLITHRIESAITVQQPSK